MIEYGRTFKFENDLAKFTVNAMTQEHPSNYGNGTLLVLDVESEPRLPIEKRISFDIRYNDCSTWDDVHEIALQVIRERFGVEPNQFQTLGKFVVEYPGEGGYHEFDTLEEARKLYDEVVPTGEEFAYLFQDVMSGEDYVDQVAIAYKDSEGERK